MKWTIKRERLDDATQQQMVRSARQQGIQVTVSAETISFFDVTEEQMHAGSMWITRRTGHRVRTR